MSKIYKQLIIVVLALVVVVWVYLAAIAPIVER